jgi:hypothetical protein
MTTRPDRWRVSVIACSPEAPSTPAYFLNVPEEVICNTGYRRFSRRRSRSGTVPDNKERCALNFAWAIASDQAMQGHASGTRTAIQLQ